jgi:hypothetical protein
MRLLLALIATVVLAGAAELHAQPRPRVLVRFRIVEATFRNTYPAIQQLQASAAQLLAAKMDSSVRYLEFVTQRPAEYELLVTLDRRDRGTQGSGEVGLYTLVSDLTPAGGLTLPDEYWVRFRTAGQYSDPRGTPAEFLRQLRLRISREHIAQLSLSRLRAIPLVRRSEASTWVPMGWILPFKHETLCLGTTSTFRIVNVYHGAAGVVEFPVIATASTRFDPRPFPARHRGQRFYVLAQADPGKYPGAGELKQIIARGGRVLTDIFVEDYSIDPQVCARPVSPAVAFGLQRRSQ